VTRFSKVNFSKNKLIEFCLQKQFTKNIKFFESHFFEKNSLTMIVKRRIICRTEYFMKIILHLTVLSLQYCCDTRLNSKEMKSTLNFEHQVNIYKQVCSVISSGHGQEFRKTSALNAASLIITNVVELGMLRRFLKSYCAHTTNLLYVI
jgi:hypothetical protein